MGHHKKNPEIKMCSTELQVQLHYPSSLRASIRIEILKKPTYISIESICRLSKESAYMHFKAFLSALLERGLRGSLLSQGRGLHGLCTRSEQKLEPSSLAFLSDHYEHFAMQIGENSWEHILMKLFFHSPNPVFPHSLTPI